MEQAQYQKIYQWFIARPGAYRCLVIAYRSMPLMVVAGYLVLLGWQGMLCVSLCFAKGACPFEAVWALTRSVVVPAIVCLLGTALRAALNLPRPYQQVGLVPLIKKDTIGHACPSRHALSASVIALAWWWQNPAVAYAMGVLALAIAALRVVAGVHSLRDVLVGLLFGLLGGVIMAPCLHMGFVFLWEMLRISGAG